MKMLFFHNSDNLIESVRPENTPGIYGGTTYFWFNDRHNHHAPWDRRYFHLFIKSPIEDNIRFYVRHGDEKYESLVKLYQNHKKEVINGNLTHEPPILMSDSVIFPDLIADGGPDASKETKVWKVVHPAQFAGIELELYDSEHKPVPFNKVSGLIKIFSSLDNYIPFSLQDEYKDWKGATYIELRPPTEEVESNVWQNIVSFLNFK